MIRMFLICQFQAVVYLCIFKSRCQDYSRWLFLDACLYYADQTGRWPDYSQSLIGKHVTLLAFYEVFCMFLVTFYYLQIKPVTVELVREIVIKAISSNTIFIGKWRALVAQIVTIRIEGKAFSQTMRVWMGYND